MAATTSQIQICNRGLQLLGYQSISSITENSRGARAMNRAYQPVLLNELRQNVWRFAVKRIQLAASSTSPLFGPSNYFPLPGDFVMLAPNDTNVTQSTSIGLGSAYANSPRDWQIENFGSGIAIATNDQSPLNVRYVSSAITESMFDVSFAEALSASLAMETCEELTQSNSKIATAEKFYDNAINQARKRNCFEVAPAQSPTDSYIFARF